MKSTTLRVKVAVNAIVAAAALGAAVLITHVVNAQPGTFLGCMGTCHENYERSLRSGMSQFAAYAEFQRCQERCARKYPNN